MDLTTQYMGLKLKNPLVASASPLTGEIDSLKRIEDAGAAAMVLPSLFQEEIEAEAARYDHLTGAHDNGRHEGLSNFPKSADAHQGPRDYLELVRRAREAVGVPVIASLNGISNAGWISYAKLLEQAGASGIELNIYFITADLGLTGADVERHYLQILKSVRSAVSIPVAVKLTPYFGSVGNMVLKLQEAGADAIVMFNRFYQPDIDLSRLQVVNDLKLSEPSELRLPLLWLAVVAGGTKASLAASTGVDSAEDVVKYLLVGADVVMTTLRAAATRPRAYYHHAVWASQMARCHGVRLSRPGPRYHEPTQHARSPGVRARQLHEYLAGMSTRRSLDRRTPAGPRSFARQRRGFNTARRMIGLAVCGPMTTPIARWSRHSG
jgi:dihydroorotate dehydrogenase (fumarate)